MASPGDAGSNTVLFHKREKKKNHHLSQHKEKKREDLNSQVVATILHSAQSMVR